jgi:septum formation inhibitor MinC
MALRLRRFGSTSLRHISSSRQCLQSESKTNVLASLVDREREKKLEYLKSWAGVGYPSPSARPESSSPIEAAVSASDQNISRVDNTPLVKFGPMASFSLPVLVLGDGVTRAEIEKLVSMTAKSGVSQGVAIDLTRVNFQVKIQKDIDMVKDLIETVKKSGMIPSGFVIPNNATTDQASNVKDLALKLGYGVLFPQSTSSIRATTSTTTASTSTNVAATAPVATASTPPPAKSNVKGSSPELDALLKAGGTMVHQGNVRSGQQVKAPPTHSLLVLGSVNPGGEVNE